MRLQIFVALICLLLVCVQLNDAKKKKKNRSQTCNEKRMDKCATVVFVFGRRDVYLPVNRKEMGPHCQEEFDALDCVKKYARKCLKPFPRQLTGIILLGATQVIKQRCTPEGTDEYLSHYPCIKRSIPKLHDCMDQLVNSLQTTLSLKPVDRIPVACCSFSRYISCSVKPIKKLCKKDKSAVDYISDKMIRGYASEVLDLACQGYEIGSDRCKKLTLPDGGFIEKNGILQQTRNITNRPLSLIPPFTSIFIES